MDKLTFTTFSQKKVFLNKKDKKYFFCGRTTYRGNRGGGFLSNFPSNWGYINNNNNAIYAPMDVDRPCLLVVWGFNVLRLYVLGFNPPPPHLSGPTTKNILFSVCVFSKKKFFLGSPSPSASFKIIPQPVVFWIERKHLEYWAAMFRHTTFTERLDNSYNYPTL